jgi:hypothetical protein
MHEVKAMLQSMIVKLEELCYKIEEKLEHESK